MTATNQQLAFYTLPSRFWQLMSGGLLFMMDLEGAAATRMSRAQAPPWYLSKWAYSAVELLAVLCMGLAFVLTSPAGGFPVPWSLLALASAWLAIGLGCAPRQRWAIGLPSPLLNAVLGSAPIAYVGRLSYPLYLWHFPLFVLAQTPRTLR